MNFMFFKMVRNRLNLNGLPNKSFCWLIWKTKDITNTVSGSKELTQNDVMVTGGFLHKGAFVMMFHIFFVVQKIWAVEFPGIWDALAPMWRYCNDNKVMQKAASVSKHDAVIKWKHFSSYWWIPLTKASDTELWCFHWSVPEQTLGTLGRWFETPSRSL